MFAAQRVVAAVAVAAVAALGLAGCSAADTGAGSGSGKTLNLSLNGAPASLDFTQFGTGTNPLLMSMIYDRLAYSAPDGSVHPQAATGWKYSKNNTVLTITLRSGMKFSNGDPVNAAAVKGTLERQKATKTNVRLAEFGAIGTIDTPNDTTVVLNLTHPDPNLVTNLGSNVGLIGDPSTFTSSDIATDPVGSGPYTMDMSQTVPNTKYVFTKNTDYWDAKQMDFPKVVVTVITDPTATFNALRSGQLDVAPLSIDQLSEAKKAGFTVSQAPYAQLGTILIADRAGKDIPALGDLRVRQAINMVFDRAAIVSSLGHGVGEPTVQPFQPNSTGFVKSKSDAYTYDVKKAKSLMAEAGYQNGFSVTMPSVEGNTTAYEPTITQALAQINIKVTWETTPFSQIVQKITSGTMPLYYWPVGWNNMPTNLDVMVRPDGFFNAYKSSTPEMQKLLAAADSAATQADATTAYQNIAKYLVDQAWFAPMFTVPNLYGAAKGVVYKPQQIDLTDNIRYYSAAE